MTDLEITKLCAEALEAPPGPVQGTGFDGEEKIWIAGSLYDPLHDDAQAMALVKKLRLGLSSQETDDYQDYWSVWDVDQCFEVCHADLNRAICECVAQMQAAEEQPSVQT